MKSDIKIIFVDIDWTILNHEIRDFDYESIEALKRAQEKGIIVSLCTARPYDSVLGTGLLDIFTPDAIVCTNGAVVFYRDKLIYENCFSIEEVNKVIEVANKYNLVVEFSSAKERWFNKEKDINVERYFSIFYEKFPPIRPYSNENITALLLFAPVELDEKLYVDFGNEFNLFRFFETAIDVHTKPILKSQGINALLDYLNIDKNNAMGIGDDDGDIPMFEAVKYSVVMGNGKETAKEKACFLTKSINEHGVKAALVELEVI